MTLRLRLRTQRLLRSDFRADGTSFAPIDVSGTCNISHGVATFVDSTVVLHEFNPTTQVLSCSLAARRLNTHCACSTVTRLRTNCLLVVKQLGHVQSTKPSLNEAAMPRTTDESPRLHPMARTGIHMVRLRISAQYLILQDVFECHHRHSYDDGVEKWLRLELVPKLTLQEPYLAGSGVPRNGANGRKSGGRRSRPSDHHLLS